MYSIIISFVLLLIYLFTNFILFIHFKLYLIYSFHNDIIFVYVYVSEIVTIL